MKPVQVIACAIVLAVFSSPATALTQGSSTVSNCGGETGNWIDLSFTTDEGVRLVDAWWDFNGSSVWLDRDGTHMCTPLNHGVTSWSEYYDVPPGTDTQDFGATFTGFDGGDDIRLTMDLDLGTGGTPFTEHYYGGTVTVQFSDGSSAVGTFDTEYDWPNGATASFSAVPPPLPNLAFNPRTGWYAPVVPRASDDATPTSVEAPLLLPGDATATWLNVSCQNDGSAGTDPPTLTIHRDGQLVHTSEYLFGFGPGAYFGPLNLGPETFTSGRHTLRVTADPDDVITESNETDNVFALQYGWAPKTLVYDTPQVRSAPPLASADLALLAPGAVRNCDGVRMVQGVDEPVDQYDWMVLWNQRLASSGVSYPMDLCTATNVPDDCFVTTLASSQGGNGLEALIVNTRNVASNVYDVGIYNELGAPENYEVGLTSEGTVNLAFGGEAPTPFTGDRLRLVEFFSAIFNLEPATLTIATDPALGPVSMGWLRSSHGMGNLADLNDVVTTDARGLAKINFELSQVGYHAVVFYRDGATAPLSATLGLWSPTPDLEPHQPPGWDAAFVPRSTDDATNTSCALPDTLYGGTASTWFNSTLINSGNAAAGAVGFGYAIDGNVDLYTWNPAATLDPGATYSITNMERQGVPFNIPGGRHTMTSMVDWHQDVTESVELNNWTGAQYCWSPGEVPWSTPITRDAPPDRAGGHSECDPGQTLYDNCDGLRLAAPGGGSYWRALAVMPPTMLTDLDMELHEPLSGATDGFGPHLLARSAWGDGAVDFVLVNDNVAPATPYDVGVLDDENVALSSYDLEAVQSIRHAKFPVGPSQVFDMPAGHMLHLNEYVFAAGPQLIAVSDADSDVDWGISIYGGAKFFGKDDHLDNGLAFSAGSGMKEQVYVDIPTAGEYCVAVWKVDQSQLDRAGAYQLHFAPGVTGIDDPVPGIRAASGLTGASPNPFNPRTTIHFTMDADGPCRLVIHDLKGRLVRTLVDGMRAGGPGEVIWDGLDESGRSVASGVYVVRFSAGAVHDGMKVALVR